MSDPTPTPGRRAATGGRAARARFDVTTLAAVVLPLLAVLAALLVDTGSEPRPAVAPRETALSTASVVCPAGGNGIQVASTSGASGDLTVRSGRRDDRDVAVAPGRSTEVDTGERAAVVLGEGDLAAGLVAASFSRPLASFDCRAPVFDHWFTGVGAGARHQSILQLVNPDEGRAVVDVEVLGSEGVVDAPGLRGVAVQGGESRSIDLAATLPRRDELTLHVSVVRGRIAASVRDTVRGIGGSRAGDDGLGSQDAPATENLLLGVPGGSGPRILFVANPGPTQERATVKVVTADAAFTPSGLEEVVLPPQSVVPVRLTRVLAEVGTGAERALGVLVESTVPTTASLQMFYRGDLVRSSPVARLDGPGTAVLPAGSKSLVLGGAAGPGAVTVTASDEGGAALPEQRVEVASDRATVVDLPDGARLVTVTGVATTSVVLVTNDDGATLVPVRAPVTTGLVPDVAPGLP
ncbi:hypothetical protein FE634_21600 [Nocardioides dongxiaopingii]|uniref:DUF5719 family protein n=1 Tax=Nocardioides sp. S-1144 TaxID=2582905 RepID=UPI00116439FA|nr:DUF5719 family protein [Nocardioides sp. S-1144]QDH10797.1 hypothetical protein FE634_21600 [Nocardioides sp. S-1144]